MSQKVLKKEPHRIYRRMDASFHYQQNTPRKFFQVSTIFGGRFLRTRLEFLIGRKTASEPLPRATLAAPAEQQLSEPSPSPGGSHLNLGHSHSESQFQSTPELKRDTKRLHFTRRKTKKSPSSAASCFSAGAEQSRPLQRCHRRHAQTSALETCEQVKHFKGHLGPSKCPWVC